MTPTNSCPITIGTGIVFCAHASQLYICMSVPQIEAFWTRMRTSLGPTSGIGTSSNPSPGSGRRFTSACIVLLTRSRIDEREVGAMIFLEGGGDDPALQPF